MALVLIIYKYLVYLPSNSLDLKGFFFDIKMKIHQGHLIRDFNINKFI